MNEFHRKVLDVSESASINTIKKQYRRLALIHHPDRGGDPVLFSQIQDSYEWLLKNHEPVDHNPIKKIKITLEEAFFGVSFKDRSKTVKIPAGTRSGTKIKTKDTIYIIDVKKHSIFKRSDDHLMVQITVDAHTVLDGVTIDIKNIDGSDISVPLKNIKRSTDVISLRGKGMPNPVTGEFGDLLISFIITFG